MAQELSQHSERKRGPTGQRIEKYAGEVPRQAVLDLDILAVWAKDNSDRVANGRIGLDNRWML
jgi:hypothetical protein